MLLIWITDSNFFGFECTKIVLRKRNNLDATSTIKLNLSFTSIPNCCNIKMHNILVCIFVCNFKDYSCTLRTNAHSIRNIKVDAFIEI